MNNSNTNYVSTTTTTTSAFISICTIIFIGGLLVIASSVFTGDIQAIVLTPIENMINMIELICSGSCCHSLCLYYCY